MTAHCYCPVQYFLSVHVFQLPIPKIAAWIVINYNECVNECCMLRKMMPHGFLKTFKPPHINENMQGNQADDFPVVFVMQSRFTIHEWIVYAGALRWKLIDLGEVYMWPQDISSTCQIKIDLDCHSCGHKVLCSLLKCDTKSLKQHHC